MFKARSTRRRMTRCGCIFLYLVQDIVSMSRIQIGRVFRVDWCWLWFQSDSNRVMGTGKVQVRMQTTKKELRYYSPSSLELRRMRVHTVRSKPTDLVMPSSSITSSITDLYPVMLRAAIVTPIFSHRTGRPRRNTSSDPGDPEQWASRRCSSGPVGDAAPNG